MTRLDRIILAAVLLVFVPAAAGAQSGAIPSPVPLPTGPPTPSPSGPPGSPGPLPQPAPVPAPTAAPASPTPSPYHYVVTPDPAASGGPAITQIAMTDRTVHSGALYAVRVTTTLDVSSVVLESYGVRFPLAPALPGQFQASTVIPTIPWLMNNREIVVHVTASTSDGRSATFPVTVRLAR